MTIQSAVAYIFKLNPEYIRDDVSHYTQVVYYDDDGYDIWEDVIYLCTPEIQFLAKYLNLAFGEVHDAILAHERGHCLSRLMGNNLSEKEEESIAWDYAEQYFYEGSKDSFQLVKDLALSSYLNPEETAGYIAAMFEYFQARGLEHILIKD